MSDIEDNYSAPMEDSENLVYHNNSRLQAWLLSEDSENQLSPTHDRSHRSFNDYPTGVGYRILKGLLVFVVLPVICLFLLIYEFALISKYHDEKEPNIESVVISRFNVSTSYSDIKGSWNVTLSLDKDLKDFKYEGRAWIHNVNEDRLISTTMSTYYDSRGNQAFEHGEFTIEKRFFMVNGEDFRYELEDLRFDLLLQGNVTYINRLSSRIRRTIFLMVDCNDLEIELDQYNVGKLLGGPKSCRVVTYPSEAEAYGSS